MKQNYFRRILSALLLLLASSFSWAYYFSMSGIYYDRTSDNTVSVTYRDGSYNSYSGTVTIPEKVVHAGVTYRVTSIGRHAFDGCSSLTSITIPNSVTSIGDWAFNECSSLTKVNIPDGVTYINLYAFAFCSSLTKVNIPNSVTNIGWCAFSGCSNLTEVSIPNSVTGIEYSAFSDCSSLPSITIPNSVTFIGSSAFYGCSRLTKVDIPNSVISIDHDAFNDCSSLTEVSIGNSVTSIGDDAFYGCNALKKIVSYAENPPSFFSYAENPPSLGITLEETILEVPLQSTCLYARADNWKEIRSIYAIKDGVKYYPVLIDREGENLVAINGSPTDTEVAENSMVEVKPVIPMEKAYLAMCGDKDMADEMFNNGYYTFSPSMYHQDNTIRTMVYPQTAIAVSTSGTLLDKVGTANIDSIYCLKVSGELNGTDILVIRKMTNLRLLDMEDARIVAGGMAYYYDYTTSADTIGDRFFSDQEMLLKVILPKSATSIGSYAFNGCSSLMEVNIPNGVTSIGKWAFYYCISLREVNIPDGVTDIGWSAFNSCSSLTKVNIPDGVTSIGHQAFEECSSLTEVNIPDGVTYIGDRAFGRCSSLTEVNIPDGVTYIGDQAFWECSGLTEVNIPNSVTSIGHQAFEECNSLTEVSIGNSVTDIGWCAFSNCTSLASVTSLNPTPPTIYSNTFDAETEKTATLHVPEGSSAIYWMSPYWENFSSIQGDASTGIGRIEADGEQEQQDKAGNAPYYTLDGKPAARPMHKGIYVRDGKKVIVK